MKKTVAALVFSLLAALTMLSKYIPNPNYDSDILWSVAIGKWIDLNRAFPVVDSFSWTIYGKEWMTHEWMYSCLAYKLSALYGNLGFYILTIIPMFFTIYFLYLMARRYDENNSYAYILPLTLGIVLLYVTALPFRAYIYALLFATLLVYLLYFKEEKAYDPLLYAGLFILWSNFQVSVFIGLVILIAESVRQFIIFPAKRKRVLFIGIVSILSTFINPYGYKLWTYFAFVISGMEESKNIAEWQAADFNEPGIMLLYLGTAASVLLLHFNSVSKESNASAQNIEVLDKSFAKTGRDISKLLNRFMNWLKKILTRENCLIIGYWCFYVYSLYSIRMFVFSLIFWVIVVCYFVGKSNRFNFSIKAYYIFLGFFVVMTFANLASANFQLKDIYTYKKEVSPVEEVAFLKENPAYSQHLFNKYLFGGYLIINDIPVFIDARSDSYIKHGIQQKYTDITGLKQDPQMVFDELGVENLLITDGILKKYIDINPQWELVFEGPNAFIYTRTDTTT